MMAWAVNPRWACAACMLVTLGGGAAAACGSGPRHSPSSRLAPINWLIWHDAPGGPHRVQLLWIAGEQDAAVAATVHVTSTRIAIRLFLPRGPSVNGDNGGSHCTTVVLPSPRGSRPIVDGTANPDSPLVRKNQRSELHGYRLPCPVVPVRTGLR